MRWMLVVCLLVPTFGTAVTWAEDPPAPASPAEPAAPADVEPPLFSIEYLMPGDDDDPDGWKFKSSKMPADGPSEKALTKLAEGCGLDDDVFYVETTVLKSGSDTVGVAMIDVEKNIAAFRAQLDALAAEGGWKIHEIGSPTRLLVVGGGSEAKRVDADQVAFEHVVYKLASLGMGRLDGGAGSAPESQAAARAYREAIAKMAPGAGVGHAIDGAIHWINSRPKKRGDKPDAAEQILAGEAFAKALAEGVRFPPRKSLLIFVAGELGGILLERKDPALLPRAEKVIELAVEQEAQGRNQTRRRNNRYHLACVYARTQRIDKALEALQGALDVAKIMPVGTWRPFHKHVEEEDPDMAPLRDDPRFSEMMEKYRPPDPKNPHK